MTTKISEANIQDATLATLLTSGGSGPKISAVIITDDEYNELDDTAVALEGGYIKLLGSGFETGITVSIDRTPATSVTFISETELHVQVAARTAGTYIVYAINTDGGVALRVNGLTYSSLPAWTTDSSLSGDSGVAISLQLVATDAATFELQAGSTLPAGLTLSSGGLLSGTVTVESETVYNFTIVAIDAELQDSPRSFSINITVGDPLFAQTSLMLPGSATIFVKDASTNNFAVSIAGNTNPSMFSPYLTNWSNYFDGTGNTLSYTLPAAIGIQSFTYEAWVYRTSSSTDENVFTNGSSNSGGWNMAIEGQKLRARSASTNLLYSTTNIPVNQWTHCAISKEGSTVRLFVNGILEATGTSTYNATATLMQIGSWTVGGGSFDFTGYISNARVVIGAAVYTTDFTPPTEPLAAISGTSILTCQSNRIIDNSTNNFTITRTGVVNVSSFSPFVEPVSTSGSGYFDGTGDYLTAAPSASFNPETVDFTVELWAYNQTTDSTNRKCLIATRPVATPLNGWVLFVSTTGFVGLAGWNSSGTLVLDFTTTSTPIVKNTWAHVSVVKVGNLFTIYVNGVLAGSVTASATLANGTNFVIGSEPASSVRDWNGYISNVRIVKGTALYTENFTPPTSPLTAIAGTSLLTLQNNTPVNNSTFLDSSSNNFVITRAGNTTQGTFSPYSPSGWSNYFDGNSDYITPASNAAFTMGTGDFTYECWVNRQGVNPVNASYVMTVFDTRTAEPSITPCLFWESNAMKYYVNGANRIVSTSTFPIGTWAHVAIVRSAGVTKMYVNGVQEGSDYTDTNNYVGTTTRIGGRFASVSSDFRCWFGHITNARIVKGTALYTENFTPPTQPLTAVAGTSLLTCADNRFVDDSPNNFAITPAGDVRVTNFSPFKAVAQTPTSYSAYFDGTGDNLVMNYNTALHLSGDFTIECWIYPTSSNGGQIINFAGGLNVAWASYEFKWNGDSVNFAASSANSGYDIGSETGTTGKIGDVTLNRWYHVAVTRSGDVYRGFLNGVQGYTQTLALTPYNPNARGLTIGSNYQTSWGVVGNIADLFIGHISNVRIVKGTALYTESFTPLTEPLTAVTGTSLLTCQSPTFVDNSTNRFAITANGNSQPTTVNPFGFTFANSTGYTAAEYSGSMYFDGTGDYLRIPYNVSMIPSAGTDFTAECWIYITGSTAVLTHIMGMNSTSVANWFIKNENGTLQAQVGNLAAANLGTAVANTWMHLALVQRSNAIFGYLNGVLAFSAGTATSWPNNGIEMTIGARSGPDRHFVGYMAGVRILKGTALYTSNFVPENRPPTPVTNTTLLLNGTSAAITDATTKNVLETVGDARISTSVSKFGGSSMYFDGTGDYLIAPASNLSTVFGIGDFTVEFWVNRSSGTRFVEFSTGLIYIDGNGKLVYYSTSARIVSTDVFPSNTWVYVTLVRASGQSKLYINGVQTGSTFTDTINYTSGVLVIGTDNGSKSQFFAGYMQDLRITKGLARYTSNFTPPTVALSAK